MAFRQAHHELHTRRASRNIGLGVCLAGFVAVVFALTLAKLNEGAAVEGFDHVVRPQLIPEAQ